MSAFDRIIGYALVKRELQQIRDTLKTREAYSRLGVGTEGAAALWCAGGGEVADGVSSDRRKRLPLFLLPERCVRDIVYSGAACCSGS